MSPRLLLACGAVAAGVSLWASSADAYCRSTVCSGDCRAEDACKKGKPLYWPSLCVGFSFQKDGTVNMPNEESQPPIERSFVQWSDVVCADGGVASMAFARLDDVACAKAEYNEDGGNSNVIIWQDNKWDYEGVTNNLAKTTVTFRESTGEILDADIEINHAFNFYTTGDEGVEYDLQSIMTHEVGHFIGLDHTPDTSATMYAGYDKGTTELRTLEPDDIAGICAAYPPGRAGKCDTRPNGGLVSACGGEESSGGDEAEEGCSIRPAGHSGTGGLTPWIFALAGWGLMRRFSLRRNPCS